MIAGDTELKLCRTLESAIVIAVRNGLTLAMPEDPPEVDVARTAAN